MADIKNTRGIQITSPFKYLSNQPLDPRTSVEDLAARDSIVAANAAYVGLRVYVRSLDKTYIYLQNEEGAGNYWKEEEFLIPREKQVKVEVVPDEVEELNDTSLWYKGFIDSPKQIVKTIPQLTESVSVKQLILQGEPTSGNYCLSPMYKLDFTKASEYLLTNLSSDIFAIRHFGIFDARHKHVVYFGSTDNNNLIAKAILTIATGTDEGFVNAQSVYKTAIHITKDFIKRLSALCIETPMMQNKVEVDRKSVVRNLLDDFVDSAGDVFYLWFTSNTRGQTDEQFTDAMSSWSIKQVIKGYDIEHNSYCLPGLAIQQEDGTNKYIEDIIAEVRADGVSKALDMQDRKVEHIIKGGEQSEILAGKDNFWMPGWSQPNVNIVVSGTSTGVEELLSLAANTTDLHEGGYLAFPALKIDTSKNNSYTLLSTVSSLYIRHIGIYSSDKKIIAQFVTTEQIYALFASVFGAESWTNYSYFSMGVEFSNQSLKRISDYAKANATNQTKEFEEGSTVYIFMTTNVPNSLGEEQTKQSWKLTKVTPTIEYDRTSFTLPGLKIGDRFVQEEFNRINEFIEVAAPQDIVKKVETETINLYEDDLQYEGKYVAGSVNSAYGTTSSYEGYCCTKLIPIDQSIDYTHSFCRHIAFLDENKIYVDYKQNLAEGVFDKAFWQTMPNCKYVWISNIGNNRNNGEFTYVKTTETKQFTMPNLRLTESNGVAAGSGSQTFTLFDVDRVGVIGDSYTESHYTIKDKSWLSKLSLFTDYNIENFAVSGDTFRGQLNKIRTGYNRYYTGMSWERMHPTHAMMLCRTNDVKYMQEDQFMNDLTAILETTEAMGAIPMIATEYHVANNDAIPTYYQWLAKKHGGYFVDLYSANLYNRGGPDYAPFWGGSHPGTRTNGILADPAIHFFEKNMPRPYQSIKIFRPRTEPETLDELLFGDIYERAKKFKEISISHSALKEPKYYDNCTSKPNEAIKSEYLMLMDGKTIPFSKYALVDVIMPATSADLSQVKLNLITSTDVDYYVRDALAEPYPAPAFCRRFDIPQPLAAGTVAVGNKYTSSNHGTTVYTVVSITSGQVESDSGFVDGTIIICSGDKSSTATNGGTLTLTSGTGSETLSYYYSSVGLSPDYPEGKQQVGHWVKLETKGSAPQSLLRRAMSVDRLSFLIVAPGDFTISNLSVSYIGTATKHRDVPQTDRYINYGKRTEQLTLENTTSTTITPITLADGCAPGLTRNTPVTVLTSYTPFTYKITGLGQVAKLGPAKIIFRVQARWFPEIFDETTGTFGEGTSPISLNSYDWGELEATLSFAGANDSKFIKMTRPVSTHWDFIDFEIIPMVSKGTAYISIKAVGRELQIGAVTAFVEY